MPPYQSENITELTKALLNAQRTVYVRAGAPPSAESWLRRMATPALFPIMQGRTEILQMGSGQALHHQIAHHRGRFCSMSGLYPSLLHWKWVLSLC